MRSYQQHHRNPQRRPEAVHWPAEALWSTGGEHRQVAGQRRTTSWENVTEASQGFSQSLETALMLAVSVSRAQTAMEAMGLIAIIVNCYLIGQCGQLQRLFPWLSPEMTIISIVLLEVCMIHKEFQALKAMLLQN